MQGGDLKGVSTPVELLCVCRSEVKRMTDMYGP